jgi:carboxyl-terminal processing protease
LPRFEEAEETNNQRAYRLAFRDFAWSIPDGHISAPFDITDFREATSGGIGISIREVEDGRVIVNYVTEASPAAEAGIQLGTEILAINGTPIQEVIDSTVAWSAPFSTDHFRLLQQMRYATRFSLGEQVSVTFVDGDLGEVTTEMVAVAESESFNFSSFNRGRTGLELPVEYELLDSGFIHAKIFSFSDNDLLTVQLWERMIRELNEGNVEGLIVDMRQNGGGSGFLADQMAAYFFDEPLILGNTARYNEERGEFYIDPLGVDRFYPPAEELRYYGPVAVIVGPNCLSACEFFSYAMTLQDRAAIVGHYPTGGLGGSVNDLLMPGSERFRYTVGRALDPDGEIHIEGKGVAPTVRIPVTEEILFAEGDPLLDAAIETLIEAGQMTINDGGDIAIGDTLLGTVEPGVAVQYTLEVSEGDVINIYVRSDEINPLLGIYDTNGSLLLANDDIEGQLSNHAGFEDLAIPRDLILILEVTSANGRETGPYTISIEDASE